MGITASVPACKCAAAGETRVFSSFVWVLAGNIVYSGCQWAVVVLLAKAGGSAMLGQYALAQAIAAPAILFAGLQLRGVIAGDLSREFPDSDYIGFRLATMVLAVAAATIPAFWTGSSSTFLPLLTAVGLVQAVEAISDTFYGLQQRQHNLARVSTALLMKGPLGLLTMAIVLWWTGNLLAAVWAQLASRIAFLLAYEVWDGEPFTIRNLLWSRPSCRWRVHARLLRKTIPLGFVAALSALISAVPRYYVSGMLGERQLGIFSGLMVMASAGSLAAAAAGQAAFVPLATLYASRAARGFVRLLALLCGVGILLGVGGVTVAVLGGERLLTIVFRPEFAGYQREFLLAAAVAGIGFTAVPIGCAMTAARMYTPQVPLLLVAVLAVTAGSALLVPRLGISGAMFALLACSLVQAGGGAGVLFWGFRHRETSRREPK